jgi:excinuclease UvrABC ATPase subunit
VRVAVDGVIKHLDDLMTEAIDVTFAKELLVVVDRLAVGDDARGRLADAVGTAFREGDGDCVVILSERRTHSNARRRRLRSPSASNAPMTALARRRQRRSSSPSTAPAAPANDVTASARPSSTTKR